MPQDTHIVIGHSLVRRLKRFSDLPAYRNLGLERDLVKFIGRDGPRKLSSTTDIQNYVTNHPNEFTNVTTCVIEAGTNDLLSSQHFLSPRTLHDQVMQVAQMIKDAGVSKVIIMPVMFRQGSAAVPRRAGRVTDPTVIYQAMLDFNLAAKSYNQFMMDTCAGGGDISFHDTTGLRRRWGSFLSDGLHYNHVGLRKHWNNVRRAIIHNASKAHS